MKARRRTGAWLIDKTSGSVSWIGNSQPQKPNIYKRIIIAYYIGRSPRSIIPNFRLMKAVIKGLNSPQVSSSGKPIVTTGLSLEEEWTRFSRTECNAIEN